MSINIEIDQSISELMDLIKEIGRWEDFDSNDLKKLDRVEMMRGKAFSLQIQLEYLQAALYSKGGGQRD